MDTKALEDRLDMVYNDLEEIKKKQNTIYWISIALLAMFLLSIVASILSLFIAPS